MYAAKPAARTGRKFTVGAASMTKDVRGNARFVRLGACGLLLSAIACFSCRPAAAHATAPDSKHLVRWKVANSKVIYVENDEQDWFRLDLKKGCTNLAISSDLSLVRETAPGADRFVVVVDRQKCPVLRVQSMNASPWDTYGVGLGPP
jgi:hypothetical protein